MSWIRTDNFRIGKTIMSIYNCVYPGSYNNRIKATDENFRGKKNCVRSTTINVRVRLYTESGRW